ncbi:hypothetical protein COU61_04865 [Candidatus Pacearchaeota archaeon CG10_big_fil_rev_8_21_14_0_10_35_13]|nr:MAG: hypothetical protein COU61_04865 [Candidatus Pacearchaeota archaeon CG10_big_fil_rev_8_21_14_0_10_35_13]
MSTISSVTAERLAKENSLMTIYDSDEDIGRITTMLTGMKLPEEGILFRKIPHEQFVRVYPSTDEEKEQFEKRGVAVNYEYTIRAIISRKEAEIRLANPTRIPKRCIRKRAHWSTRHLMGELERDPMLLALIADSDSEISLLSKMRTRTSYANEERFYQETRPLLLIPGTRSNGSRDFLNAWEEQNTKHRAGTPLFGLFDIRWGITREEYNRREDDMDRLRVRKGMIPRYE